MKEPEEVLLGIGSNLGDRLRHLREAVGRLAAELEVDAVSAFYETPPEGGADQPPYLNAAVRARTCMEPEEVLAVVRRVEGRGGRERQYAGAPRTVDVDILFHGDRMVDAPDLVIPHPRWSVRSFVLRPLLDVAPGLRDPRTGRTVREVWEDDRHGPLPIRKVELPERLDDPGREPHPAPSGEPLDDPSGEPPDDPCGEPAAEAAEGP